MKGVYLLNKVILIITLVLYLTLYLGMYSQIVLGLIQVLSAIFLFTYWKKFSSITKKQLSFYWILTILYGLCWLLDWQNTHNTYVIIFGIIVLPMSIAGYFFYILNSIKNMEK